MSFPHGLVPTTQRVHPTPIYELLVALLIAGYLWRRGAKSGDGRTPPLGQITGEYLVLSGVARFLVEFIRINPAHLLGHEQCSGRQPGLDRRRHFAHRLGPAPQHHGERCRGDADRSCIPAGCEDGARAYRALKPHFAGLMR